MAVSLNMAVQSNGRPPDLPPRRKEIGILELTVMIYCLVCAGAYGIEEAVRYGGPFTALIVLLLISLCTGLPQSFIYSELSTMFPETGSTIIWPLDIVHGLTKAARTEPLTKKMMGRLSREITFARFMARLSSNMLLCNAIVDNAVMPTLVSDYLELLLPELDKWYYRLMVGLVCFMVILVLNIYGIDAVGWSLYVLTFITVTPIVLFIFCSLPEWDMAKLAPSNRPEETFNLNVVISNMVWQFAGLEQITNLSGDVWRPHITYPVSYIISIVLVILTYALTITGGVMVEDDFEHWINGSLGDISLLLPGCANGWLRYWLIIGGALSGLSIANSCVSCTSRELYTNAHCGLLPFGSWVDRLRSFRKPRRPTPTTESTSYASNTLDENIDLMDEDEMDELGLVPYVGIIICCLVPAVMTVLPFTILVEMDAFIIAANTIMQICFYHYARFGARGYLRRHPEVVEKFTLRIKAWAMVIASVFPLVTYCILICTSEWYSFVGVLVLQFILFALRGIEICVTKKRTARVDNELLYQEEHMQ